MQVVWSDKGPMMRVEWEGAAYLGRADGSNAWHKAGALVDADAPATEDVRRHHSDRPARSLHKVTARLLPRVSAPESPVYCLSLSATPPTPDLQSFEAVRHYRPSAMTAVQTLVAPDQQLEETPKAQYNFNFSDFLRREYRFGLDPNRPLCRAYQQGHCPLGGRCPDKHHVSSSYNKCVALPSLSGKRSLF